jgi:FAD/FMN-containing dehydrogenase
VSPKRHEKNQDIAVLVFIIMTPVKPITIWEVSRVIKAASMTGIHVRATGAGHTRSPLYPDEGHIMMDVRNLQRHDGPAMELHKPV